MAETNYDQILENIKVMVKLLEYDSQRSSGKMKLNSQHLHSLLWLQDHYENKVKKPTPVKRKEG